MREEDTDEGVNLILTATGRMSSAGPDIQDYRVSTELRKVLVWVPTDRLSFGLWWGVLGAPHRQALASPELPYSLRNEIPTDGSVDANAGGNVYKFSKGEKRVHDVILGKYSQQSMEWKSIREMAKDLGISSETVRVALKGRKSSQKAGATEGLLTKMPGLDTVMVSKSEDNTLMTPEEIKEWERNHMQNIIETGLGDGRTIRKYDTIIWDCKAYWQDRNTRQAVIKWKD